MKTYPKYKDSGVKGLEAIPSTWNIVRVKHTGTIRHGLSYKPSDICNAERGILVLRASNIQNGKLAFEDNVFVTPNIVPKEKRVQEGDIIMCSTNGSLELVGKCALIDRPLEASFGSFMLQYHPNCNSRYMYYQLSYLVNLYRGRFSTSTINQITMSMLGDIDAAMPPLAEQQAIAEYLDKKTGDIDELVGLLNKQIADVRAYRQSLITETVTQGLNKNVSMKDSGIEWIGQIPKAWKISKCKYHLQIHSGDAIPAKDVECNGKIPIYGGGEIIGYCNKSNTNENNIIIGRVGARCGCVSFPNRKVWATDNALIVEAINNAKYYYYLLSSLNLNSYNTSNAQPLITGSTIKELALPISPLSEQQQIVEFLDAKTKDIDELLSKLEAQVADLLAYKSSLISEVVTGKIDIR